LKSLSLLSKNIPRLLAAVFVAYGLITTAFLAIELPPFQNPDEENHFLRAAQIADGGLVGARFTVAQADGSVLTTAGGEADPAVPSAQAPFNPLVSHPGNRAARSMWSPQIVWSGARVKFAFPNTAIYPPVFYLPSALGIGIGRAAGLTVVRTLMVSRLLTGVAAVFVGAVAIGSSEAGAVWLFAILTLPMSLSLIASSSQDALLLACSAMAAALLMRGMRVSQPRSIIICWVVALILVAIARPPYVGLAVLPFAVTTIPRRQRILAAAAIFVGVVAWSGLAVATSITNTAKYYSIGADPAAQMALLLQHPLMVAQVARATLVLYWRVYLEAFIGRLGWLDTALPASYRAIAVVVLGIAALATTLGREQQICTGSRLVIASGVLLSAIAIFAIQYLTWTVPGDLIVSGVQGRYFLPLAMVAGTALPSLGGRRWQRLHDVLVLAVITFPVITLGVVMRAIMLRYYSFG
jgi:uncharacterized membrane protein